MSKPLRIKSKSREDWLYKRKRLGLELGAIGGSDAAAVVSESPWKTADELWKEKTGQIQRDPEDLSNDVYVQQGIRMEPALRTLYKAKHPEYIVHHEPYDIWYQEEREFMFVTLDGRIKERETGKMGCLEIKTATPNGKAGWAKWNEQVPRHYYIQCLHEIAVMNYDFMVLYAGLINRDDDMTIREYRWERSDVEADIQWLIEKETEFWNSVQNRSIPPMTILF